MKYIIIVLLILSYGCSRPTKRAPSQELASNELDELTINDPFFSEKLNIDVEVPKRKPTSASSLIDTYTVKAEDTLMLISFKLYGHHKRWREILKLNKSAIKDYNNLVEGTVLSYRIPDKAPVIPKGAPYLIKRGDSLSLISGKVYGSIHKWRPIFENNRTSIDDPNLIFAGFTVWYPQLKMPSFAFQD